MIDYTNKPINELRRKDRGKDEVWIKNFLKRAPYGVLATENGGQPFININLFVYDEDSHAIFLHTAHVGRTRANVESNPQVCFSASEMGRLLPADEAIEASVEYSSVIVFGRASLVANEQIAKHGLQLLMDKYFPHLRPGSDYRPTSAEDLKLTAVYRIDIESWSGKQKKAPDDFPGAFSYSETG
jgi:nitroimidazol reductase NimA-like FMN-containing flavoprotein (pyridoxamine 5'-phosphate oxidase superfamily)